MKFLLKAKRLFQTRKSYQLPQATVWKHQKNTQGHNLQSHSSRCPEEDITVESRSPQTNLNEDAWSERGGGEQSYLCYSSFWNAFGGSSKESMDIQQYNK